MLVAVSDLRTAVLARTNPFIWAITADQSSTASPAAGQPSPERATWTLRPARTLVFGEQSDQRVALLQASMRGDRLVRDG